MHMKKMLERIACLESINDQLSTELTHVDRLLRAIGFSDGLETVKAAARELYEQEHGQSAQKDLDELDS